MDSLAEVSMGKRDRKNAARLSFLRLPEDVSKIGIGLVDQQMWCWGCDVRSPTGNLLIQHGFIRCPSPEPRFHSAYRLCEVIPGGVLTLWSWGLWIAAPEWGSLFISRTRFRVRWLPEVEPEPNAWQERDLPHGSMGMRPKDAFYLLYATCSWIAGYERWVSACCDASYRMRTLAAWPQRRRFKGDLSSKSTAAHWEALAERLTTFDDPKTG